MSSVSRSTRLILMIAVLVCLTNCGKKTNAPSGSGRPPTEVAIITITPKRLAITNELPGRIEATRIAQVRARVAGIILQRHFVEGSEVKAGQLLYSIDPAQFRANLDSAKATLERSEASLMQSSLRAARFQPLLEVNAISKQDYDDASAAQKQAQADVAAAKAALQSASLNLGYASVTSPIAGRIGRALVTEGALVGQGEATPLATVQQLDPIYATLTQSSIDLLQLQQAMASGQLKMVDKNKVEVTLVTEDGRPYPLPGKLLFSDVTVDATTGNITLRAEFPNPDRRLLPGMYVRASLQQAINEAAILVPQQAIMRSLNGSTVMVVNGDNTVALRNVVTAAAEGNNWVVSEGLKSGDRVIVEGLQKTRPGATVKPVTWNSLTVPASANAPPSAAIAQTAANKTN